MGLQGERKEGGFRFSLASISFPSWLKLLCSQPGCVVFLLSGAVGGRDGEQIEHGDKPNALYDKGRKRGAQPSPLALELLSQTPRPDISPPLSSQNSVFLGSWLGYCLVFL